MSDNPRPGWHIITYAQFGDRIEAPALHPETDRWVCGVGATRDTARADVIRLIEGMNDDR